MSLYQDDIKAIAGLKDKQGRAWNAINPESAARMRAQNKFKTGLDISLDKSRLPRGQYLPQLGRKSDNMRDEQFYQLGCR